MGSSRAESVAILVVSLNILSSSWAPYGVGTVFCWQLRGRTLEGGSLDTAGVRIPKCHTYL